MNTVLNLESTPMLATWQRHTHAEFLLKDPDAALATMSDNPYVICVPTGSGGEGREGVFDFYDRQFLPAIPPDMELLPVSLVCGQDRIVEEMLARFTHSVPMDWMLPGVPPTARWVELMLVAVIGFESDKIASEHIYWDQTTVLSQLGVLNVPSAGAGVGSASRIRRLMSANQSSVKK